jgi:hypothetical protein
MSIWVSDGNWIGLKLYQIFKMNPSFIFMLPFFFPLDFLSLVAPFKSLCEILGDLSLKLCICDVFFYISQKYGKL